MDNPTTLKALEEGNTNSLLEFKQKKRKEITLKTVKRVLSLLWNVEIQIKIDNWIQQNLIKNMDRSQ